jgi:hypothetical protein
MWWPGADQPAQPASDAQLPERSEGENRPEPIRVNRTTDTRIFSLAVEAFWLYMSIGYRGARCSNLHYYAGPCTTHSRKTPATRTCLFDLKTLDTHYLQLDSGRLRTVNNTLGIVILGNREGLMSIELTKITSNLKLGLDVQNWRGRFSAYVPADFVVNKKQTGVRRPQP